MERISIIDGFSPKNDAALLEKAEALRPVLRSELIRPIRAISPCGKYLVPFDTALSSSLSAGDGSVFDFGSHFTGYISLDLGYSGSHPDAPAYIRLQFAEKFSELSEDAEAYSGWISKSWIQSEEIHIDKLPAMLALPRRYAFRYMKLTVLGVSKKYRLTVKDIVCRAVSSADLSIVSAAAFSDGRMERIDAVSIKTLAECMQEVYEDGPKRDRRLWLGDFRLEALTNSVTFRNFGLTKRCLYLFAGSRFPDDRVSACLFTDGEATADDTWFSDYALMYPVILAEYFRDTGDKEALDDLYDIAVKQMDISLDMCEDDVVSFELAEKAFIDWCPGLDKTAAAQGVLLYALHHAAELAGRMGDAVREKQYLFQIKAKSAAARRKFLNGSVFVSNGQVSAASQIWLVLGGVLEKREAAFLLESFPESGGEYPMVTPYMHHYYTEALLKAGLNEKAAEHIRSYWGGMLDDGADTFYEIWDPNDPKASPYGGTIVNSYCHAWSCTPSFFLRSELTI